MTTRPECLNIGGFENSRGGVSGLPCCFVGVKRSGYQLNTWSRSASFTMKVTSWGGSFSFLK
jgi:hypothetical protein